MTINDLMTILPTLIVVVWAILLLLVDLWIPTNRKGITALLAALGLAIALGVNLAMTGQTGGLTAAFSGMVVLDGFAVFANTLILVSSLFGVALAHDYLRRLGITRGEYYVLLLVSTAGMMLFVQSNDLIALFLALELLSIPLYVLAGFARPRTGSEESAMKYFFLGAFSSAIFLYGIAMVYGGSATTSLPGVVAAFQDGANANLALLLIGAGLLLVGLGFKISAVPFHQWTPDVYEGAPASVTAWMAVAVKVAGLAALLRVFIVAFPMVAEQMQPVLWVIAALTMITGNIVAIAQNNLKRLLAYSSIAHVGYLLMAFVPYGNGEVVGNSIASVLFYLIAYGLTSFAAWGVVIAAEQNEGRALQLDDYAGLGRKYPWLGVAMMAAMFSFTGIPLTLGFWGKYYLFKTAVEGGAVGLALIGLVASIFSAYYYLRVLVVMYMRPGEPSVRQDSWLGLVTIGSAAAVVLLAFVPGTIFSAAAQALLSLP